MGVNIETESGGARERRLAAARDYARKNADAIRIYKKKWVQENAEHVSDLWRNHYELNAEKIKKRSNEWRRNNVERKRANNKKWALDNPDKQRASEIKSKRNRRASSPQLRLFESVSKQIWFSLKEKKNGARWEHLVGFARPELIAHIERQFLKGMSWANYGREWHIDHIVPASSFKYDGPQDEEFKACWALTNLRPLWAKDNIRKRDQRLHLI